MKFRLVCAIILSLAVAACNNHSHDTDAEHTHDHGDNVHAEDDHDHSHPLDHGDDLHEDEHAGDHEEDSHFHADDTDAEHTHDPEEEHAHESSEEPSVINLVDFTEEQSAKIDFKIEQVVKEPFGQVIRTAARVKAGPQNERVLVARNSGIVVFPGGNLLPGQTVRADESIVKISSGGIAERNISVAYAEAKINFENTEAAYARKKELARDTIIAESELLDAKRDYENARAVFENLSRNISADGQVVRSPMDGFIADIFVTNGEYVTAGQSLVQVSQSGTLILEAFLPQKYRTIIPFIQSANIRTMDDRRIYTLEQLNGRVVSYGKSLQDNNHLLPVYLEVENTPGFVAGSLVEVFLHAIADQDAIAIPNSALIEEQGTYFVYVENAPELYEKRVVSVGVSDGIRTEIRSGLHAEERFVSRGATMVNLAQATGALDPHSGHVH